MSVQIPSFELGKTKLTEDQFKDALESGNSKGKGFSPGNYKLKITEAQYHVNKETGAITSKADPSWINVSMNLVGADGRSKKFFIMVPTKDIWFTNKDGKKSIFMFTKLQQFFAAVGVYLDYQNYAGVIKQYFSSPDALNRLNGEEVSVDIGFTGPYVKFVEQGKFRIVLNNEELKSADGDVVEFSDADSAVAYGATVLLKNLQRFPEIVKLHASPEKKSEQKAAGNDGW
jgi:hypothetical protein